MIRMRAGMATDIGKVRANNQDRGIVADGLFGVADGMGGHRGGEVASTLALAALTRAWTETTSPAAAEDLSRAAISANRAVFATAAGEVTLAGMGTTLTVLAAVRSGPDDVLAIAHVGDSRAYRLRSGELEQLTDDHSYVAELQRDGRITAEQARTHSQRSIVTRAVGVEAEVEVDLLEIVPSPGHRYLLCSDGLTGEVPDEVIASYLRRLADPEEAARALVAAALESGGRDNITVVVVDVLDSDPTLDDSAGPANGDASPPRDPAAPPSTFPPPPDLTNSAEFVEADGTALFARPSITSSAAVSSTPISDPATRPIAEAAAEPLPTMPEDQPDRTLELHGTAPTPTGPVPANSVEPLGEAASLPPVPRRRGSRTRRVRSAIGLLLAVGTLVGLALIARWAIVNDPARNTPVTTISTTPTETTDPFAPEESVATTAVDSAPPTLAPTSPSASPTTSPSTSPTTSPTTSPSASPATSPTTSPSASPTTSPPTSPTTSPARLPATSTLLSTAPVPPRSKGLEPVTQSTS